MRFNESIFSFKKKKTIDDIYIKGKINSTKKVTPPSEDDYVIGMEIQDFDLYKDYRIINAHSGLFTYNEKDYFRSYKFSSSYSGEGVWFDISHYYDELYEISDKLGLIDGASVIADNKEGVIDGMNLLVFYKCHNEVFNKGFERILTLGYNVNGRWYQPSELTLIKDVKKSNIIGEEIEDNFLDMIESEELTFVVKEEYVDKNQSWRVHLRSDFSTPQNLDKVTSQLLVMTKRLEHKNISTKITDINLDTIEFICSSF